MKVKYLKRIRRYWEYRFYGESMLFKRKSDGHIEEFDNAREFLLWIAREDISSKIYDRYLFKNERIEQNKLNRQFNNY